VTPEELQRSRFERRQPGKLGYWRWTV